MNRKIILTVLSPLKDNASSIIYKCGLDKMIEAKWTNEAGLKYLLMNKSVTYTDIICLCSEQTNSRKYEDRVNEIIKSESDADIKVHFITYSTSDDISNISDNLTKEFEFVSSDTIYMDTSGGYRSVVYALIYLFRYFEYIGVKVESAIYSSYEGKIEEITDTFRMFTLINGAHEFTSTGNPHTLKEYFANTKNKTIIDLLEAMKKFYDNISLCRIGNEMDESIKAMDAALQNAEKLSPQNYDESRLVDLLSVIRTKLFPSRKSKYLGLIEWCMSNNLFQQAITIYVEKLPKAYFTELKFLTADFENLSKKSGNPGTEIYQDYFITSSLDDYKQRTEEMLEARKTLIYAPRNCRKPLLFPAERDCEELYQMVIKIRDTFYDNRGCRLSAEPKGKEVQQLLNDTFKTFTMMPKNLDGLLKDKSRLVNFVKSKNDKSADDNDLKKIKGVCKGLNDENVTINISPDSVLKLRLDYLYMKYVRNQVNHASENETYDSEYKKMFSKIAPELYIFPKGNSVSADQIRAFIKQSVEYIKNIN